VSDEEKLLGPSGRRFTGKLVTFPLAKVHCSCAAQNKVSTVGHMNTEQIVLG
jgi:hypothetical protein